jgi:hypothetical protein
MEDVNDKILKDIYVSLRSIRWAKLPNRLEPALCNYPKPMISSALTGAVT